MLERATGGALVLLDELGRATDPEEGGALGVTVLETFRARGAFTLASTHLMAMKVYGASTSGVLNGSMGFDEATLQPTYVLRLGAPGKSAGLDIASRLGLDPGTDQKTRAGRIPRQDRDVARFLGETHQKLEQLETERAELAVRSEALVQREQGLEQTWERKVYSEASWKWRTARRTVIARSLKRRRAGNHRGFKPESAHQDRQEPSASFTSR